MRRRLPALALTGGYVRRDEELGTTTSDGVYVPTRLQDQTSAGLKLTQPLFNGRIGAALRAAKLYEEWTEAAIRGGDGRRAARDHPRLLLGGAERAPAGGESDGAGDGGTAAGKRAGAAAAGHGVELRRAPRAGGGVELPGAGSAGAERQGRGLYGACTA